MNSTEEQSEVAQGVYVSPATIYNKLLSVDTRLSGVEERQKSSIPDSDRIRKIETQMSAIWVLYGLMSAVVVTNIIDRLN